MLTKLEYGMLATSATNVINQVASNSVLGKVKVGTNLSIDGNGVLSADAAPYTLPTASDSVLGGVKVGSGLAIDGNGILSATAHSPSFVRSRFVGNGTATEFGPVTSFVNDVTKVMVFVDGIEQEPVDGLNGTWTLNPTGSKVAFNEAIPDGIVVRVVVVSA